MNSKKKLQLKKIDITKLNHINGGRDIVPYSTNNLCRLTLDNPTVVETCHKSFLVFDCQG